MFKHTATICKNWVLARLIPSQLTYRWDWNFTYNNISDHATNKLNASQLTLSPLYSIIYHPGRGLHTENEEHIFKLVKTPVSAC